MHKVLVVDDMPDNVKLMSYHVADAGYEVLTAKDGREALEIMHSEGPPIVLTDWMMPEMDGLEFCRAVRESESIGFAYIIIVTANSDEDQLVEAFESGADDFLPKPYHLPELLVRLKAGVRIVELEASLEKERLEAHKANAELAVLNETINRLATTDELTGVSNRREAMRHLGEQWSLARRHGQPLTCLMFDIDHFKKFNDDHGHDVGDAVLQSVAQTLRKTARKGEQVFRIGGEEFFMLCSSAGESEGAEAGERLRRAVESTVIQNDVVGLSVTISVGVAQATEDMKNPEELLKQADIVLYSAKASGRNRVCVASASEVVVESEPQ